MNKKINLELIDKLKQKARDIVSDSCKKLKSSHYIDARVDINEGKSAYAENGSEKAGNEDYGFNIGIKSLAGDKYKACGFFGQTLGNADVDNFDEVLKNGISHAHERALFNSGNKEKLVNKYKDLGASFFNSSLAPVRVHVDTISAEYKIDPLKVNLKDILELTKNVSSEIMKFSGDIKYNHVTAYTSIERELFCSSEGALIDQSFAYTQGSAYIVAVTKNGNYEMHDVIGHQRGFEILLDGVNEPYIKNPDFTEFARILAKEAISLANAPSFKSTDKEVVVVTSPDYNYLKVHEIVGHPTELDRALKQETAYAGRSWLIKDMNNNMLGKQIASPLVSAYSDPSLPGYGYYKYDHEGTLAKKVMLIDKGILKGFMNSRQTAAIFNVEPNGSAKAIGADYVPIVRMSNTVFAAGDKNPDDIIKEVDHGYYVSRARTPSIAESRENFRITAAKVYEIKNGKLGQLYKNGGIMADTKDYLMKVDAVGNDFRLFAVPNCGKGQPMQTKRLGNGGPTMRSRSLLTGGKI